MTRGRTIATIVAAFIVLQVLGAIVHGFVLAADYAPFEGTLLRRGTDNAPPWQMLFLVDGDWTDDRARGAAAGCRGTARGLTGLDHSGSRRSVMH